LLKLKVGNELKKVLFVATVVKNHIMVFHLPYLKWFKENGYEVHVCAKNDYDIEEESNIPFCDKYYNLSFERSPFKAKNIKVYKHLKEIIDVNQYDIIHCHTPMGGVLTRLAAIKSRKYGTKVVYTAHGFHFYKGAPIKNWLLYYPMERWLARFTDCLITINKEDYDSARENFKTRRTQLVNGVGIDLQKFAPQTLKKKNHLRYDYGYNEDDFILMYAGELSFRKHQDLLIEVISLLKNKIPNIKLLLAGTGDFLDQYKKQVERLGIKENVEFLGYRNDVSHLMMISDLAVSSSRQEGLPVNIMEAMATGLPLVVTDCRGNRDLVSNGKNGFVVGINDVKGFANNVEKLYKSRELRQCFGEESLEMVKKYSLSNVLNEMKKIYSVLL
jgi:glycosyltransferase EpsD